jgi:predicted O-methyltransferase YrrM
MQLGKKDKVFIGAAALLVLILLVGGWSLEVPLISHIAVTLAAFLILSSQFELYRRTQNIFSAGLQANRRAILREQRTHYEQLESLLSLFSVLELRAPLPKTRGYPASPDFLKLVADLIFQRKPTLIVEAGSGVSTLIGAYCLEYLGCGRIISLEHDQKFLSISKKDIELHGLNYIAEVVFAPLREVDITGQNRLWYDIGQLDKMRNIDMLIIDGPPGYIQPLIRYPALPVLFDCLSDNAIIVMDDGARGDEKKTVEVWLREFPCFVCEYVPLEKGAFIIRKVSDTATDTLPRGMITSDITK